MGKFGYDHVVVDKRKISLGDVTVSSDIVIADNKLLMTQRGVDALHSALSAFRGGEHGTEYRYLPGARVLEAELSKVHASSADFVPRDSMPT